MEHSGHWTRNNLNTVHGTFRTLDEEQSKHRTWNIQDTGRGTIKTPYMEHSGHWTRNNKNTVHGTFRTLDEEQSKHRTWNIQDTGRGTI